MSCHCNGNLRVRRHVWEVGAGSGIDNAYSCSDQLCTAIRPYIFVRDGSVTLLRPYHNNRLILFVLRLFSLHAGVWEVGPITYTYVRGRRCVRYSGACKHSSSLGGCRMRRPATTARSKRHTSSRRLLLLLQQCWVLPPGISSISSRLLMSASRMPLLCIFAALLLQGNCAECVCCSLLL